MDPILLLLFGYCAAIFAASFAGGRFSVLGALTHTRTQVVMSLVAGLMLGIALYHLLPHGLELIPQPESAKKGLFWAALGIIAMVGLLRMFQFNQYDFSADAQALRAARAHGRHAVNARSVASVALGMSIHAITEGIALGAAVQAGGPLTASSALPGLGAFVAIALHKPLDAYSVLSMMRSGGYSRRSRNLANLGFALLCPLVALATFWAGAQLGATQAGVLAGYALCFTAGTFLCVALSDLLPEIHFHSHDRLKLMCALLVGTGIAYALRFAEAAIAPHGH